MHPTLQTELKSHSE